MPPCRALPPTAPGVSENYKTPVTNLTYYLNTSYVSWVEGEAMCKRNGGHLAAYNSSAEQVRGLCWLPLQLPLCCDPDDLDT